MAANSNALDYDYGPYGQQQQDPNDGKMSKHAKRRANKRARQAEATEEGQP